MAPPFASLLSCLHDGWGVGLCRLTLCLFEGK